MSHLSAPHFHDEWQPGKALCRAGLHPPRPGRVRGGDVHTNTVEGFLMRRLQQISIDSKVARLAHDLRDYYAERADLHGGKILATPDALHLATAILYRADEFHTFDSGGVGKSLGLLPLGGDIGSHKLVNCKPVATTPELDLRRTPPGGKK